MIMPPKRSSDSDDAGDMKSSGKRTKYDKGSDEYSKRRERNNIAVKKSREKSRQKAKETTEQVSRLRTENEVLEQKVQILSKELSVLKDLFLAHAGSVSQGYGVTDTSDSRVPESPTDHGYSKSFKIETK